LYITIVYYQVVAFGRTVTVDCDEHHERCADNKEVIVE
jgi:hypothetical protein